ncbi:MAG: theronine dehydrogenase, partial [Carnobacterium sp.]
RGGGLVEMGFFVDNGEAKINPHHDLCKKEITLIGSWTYLPTEYPITIAFMKRAKEIGIQLETLITHRYGLDELNEAMETNIA